MSSNPEPERLRRIRSSVLWAAHGDALGFISELASEEQVRARGAALPLTEPVAWKRRVGGRFGSTVALPAGCISDDTQLRLATCRSIRGDGVFDVETFSKIELTTWVSYALGAGRGSQEAAANLRRRDVTWATNFFEAERSVYVNAGGNGAAMRVQPHAWAARPGDNDGWHTDVMVNAVCTHGHLRGILGALFHAICVHQALERGAAPGPEQWDTAAEALRSVPQLVRGNDLLDHLWLGLWEQRSAASLESSVDGVVAELRENLKRAFEARSGPNRYESAVAAIAADRPEDRGSGVKTAVLAAVAAHIFEGDPTTAIRACANRLGTDTDSIATMAGAILGATSDEIPEVPIADRAYLEREGERMWAIGAGRRAPNFPYPSITTWSPPRSQLDSLGTAAAGLSVAGLGPAVVHGDEILAGSENRTGALGWIDLWFGQRVLIKRRPRPNPLQESQLVSALPQYTTGSLRDAELRASPQSRPSRQLSLSDEPSTEQRPAKRRRTLHEITDEVIGKGMTAEAIGDGFLEVAEREDGIELAAQYASIVAKARLTRIDRERRR